MAGPGDITTLLRRARGSDLAAESALYELVYHQLRRKAHFMLYGDRMAPLVSSRSVVHESFEKLFRSGSSIEWKDRAQFYRVAARAMHQVIIERARRRAATTRGGGLVEVPLEMVDLRGSEDAEIELDLVIAVSEMCVRLAAEKPRAAEVVELRFFAGLTIAETAEALGVSETIVLERQRFATAFMRREL